mgnify:CR=1 FL=1
MKVIIAQTLTGRDKKLIYLLKEKLEAVCKDTAVEIWEGAGQGMALADLKRKEPDLFINFNLSGFEQETLTGGIAYNLSNCKQIHFLLSEKLPNEHFLEKQMSIAMFFYCVGTAYCQYLSSGYPEIPYLKEIEGWEDTNAEDVLDKNAGILCNIVTETAKICRLIS